MKKEEFKDYLEKETFNVYELEYTKEFKDKLPIKWKDWANKDLTGIPEIYHVLWRVDWNWGPYSKMDILDREFCHELFLEYHHWDIQRKIKEENERKNNDN